jgi:hypothetical protein
MLLIAIATRSIFLELIQQIVDLSHVETSPLFNEQIQEKKMTFGYL